MRRMRYAYAAYEGMRMRRKRYAHNRGEVRGKRHERPEVSVEPEGVDLYMWTHI